VYCRFCTRSYAVGANTETVSKSPQKPSRRRWEVVFQHIENDPSLHDIVVSGGDAYYLQPDDLREIGERFVNVNRPVITSDGQQTPQHSSHPAHPVCLERLSRGSVPYR
jgi:L-lysine 2,3-aminomutase